MGRRDIGLRVLSAALSVTKQGRVTWGHTMAWGPSFSWHDRVWSTCHASNDINYTVILTDDGTLYTYGVLIPLRSIAPPLLESKSGHFRKLSHALTTLASAIARPTKLPLQVPIVAIVCGAEHVVACTSNRALLAWGVNSHGQLGIGNLEPRDVPTPVVCRELTILLHQAPTRGHFRLIAGPLTTAIHFTDPPVVWAWGHLASDSGVSTVDPSECVYATHIYDVDRTIRDVQFGHDDAIALTDAGSLYTWLRHTKRGNVRPMQLPERPIVAIAVGTAHMLARVKSGHIYAWGGNVFGQCGVGSFATVVASPQRVLGLPASLDATDIRLTCQGHTSQLQADGCRSAPPPVAALPLPVAPTPFGFERTVPRGTSVFTFGAIVCKGREHLGDSIKLHLPRGAVVLEPVIEHSAPALAVVATPIHANGATLTVAPVEIGTRGQYTSCFHAARSGQWQLWITARADEDVVVLGDPLKLSVALPIDAKPRVPPGGAMDRPRLTHISDDEATTWHRVAPDLPCRVTMHHLVALQFDVSDVVSSSNEWVVACRGSTVAHVQQIEDRSAATLVVVIKYIAVGASHVYLRRGKRSQQSPPSAELHVTYRLESCLAHVQLHRLAMQSYYSSVGGSFEKLAAWLLAHRELAAYVHHSVLLEVRYDVWMTDNCAKVVEQRRLAYGWDVWHDLRVPTSWLDIEYVLAELVTSCPLPPKPSEPPVVAVARWLLAQGPTIGRSPTVNLLPTPVTVSLSLRDLVLTQAVVPQEARPAPLLKLHATRSVYGDILYVPHDTFPTPEATVDRRFIGDALHRLRVVLLDRRRSAHKSFHDLYHHFHRQSHDEGFDVAEFATALDDIGWSRAFPSRLTKCRLHLSDEVLHHTFHCLNIDASGRICLGELKVFLMDIDHAAFWNGIAPHLVAAVHAQATPSSRSWAATFDTAKTALEHAGYDTVGIDGGDCNWEVFTLGLQALLPDIAPPDLARLVYRFDTRGNGLISLWRFERALLHHCEKVIRQKSPKPSTRSSLLPRDRPQVEAFSSPKAVQKLYKSRAIAQLVEGNEGDALRRQGNVLL
ncbi:hypothetical protein ACHHYP_11347, partial [Achlya hypogyna]